MAFLLSMIDLICKSLVCPQDGFPLTCSAHQHCDIPPAAQRSSLHDGERYIQKVILTVSAIGMRSAVLVLCTRCKRLQGFPDGSTDNMLITYAHICFKPCSNVHCSQASPATLS